MNGLLTERAPVDAAPTWRITDAAVGNVGSLSSAVCEPRSTPVDAHTRALQAASNALVLQGWVDPKEDIARCVEGGGTAAPTWNARGPRTRLALARAPPGRGVSPAALVARVGSAHARFADACSPASHFLALPASERAPPSTCAR